MYLNVAVLFISEYPLHSCILEHRLEMSVCNFFGCNEDITCLLNVPKPLMLHETCMLHECRKRLQNLFNMHVALRMLQFHISYSIDSGVSHSRR